MVFEFQTICYIVHGKGSVFDDGNSVDQSDVIKFGGISEFFLKPATQC